MLEIHAAQSASLTCYKILTHALFAWLISQQPAVLFSQNKPATSNQPAVLFSQNKPAPAISHQPTEQAARFQCDPFLTKSRSRRFCGK
jgi:hypothetical protein